MNFSITPQLGRVLSVNTSKIVFEWILFLR